MEANVELKGQGSLFPALSAAGGALLLGFGAASAAGLIAVGIDAKTIWALSALGVGLLGYGIFAALAAARFGLLFMVLVAGLTAQLWLTEPLWFTHIRLRPKSTGDMVALAGLAAQAAIIFGLLLRTRLALGVRFLLETGPLRILALLLLTAAFCVSPMGLVTEGRVTSFAVKLVATALISGMHLVTIGLMIGAAPPRLPSRTPSAMILAFLAFAASLAMTVFAFERLPHVEDEVAYLFQARTIVGGALTAPAPAADVQPALDYYLMEFRDGRWLATTMPGWPAVLAVGIITGAYWLLNPLLAAIAVVLTYAVARQLSEDRTVATIAAAVVACSPWLIGAAGTLMPHPLTICLMLLCWWLLLKAVETRHNILALSLLAGVCMGWVFVTRQMEGFLLGWLTGFWLLSHIRSVGGFTLVAGYAVGCLLSGSFYFIYNMLMTGNPLLSPLQRYIDDHWFQGANGFGFGPNVGPPNGWGLLSGPSGHTPIEGVLNTLQNMQGLHLEFMGWAFGSLLLVWCSLLLRRPGRIDLAMWSIIGAIALAHFPYWFSGSFFVGPRYWFAAIFPLAYLSALGFRALSNRLENFGVSPAALPSVFVALCAISLLIFLPWRGTTKYHEYGGFTDEVRQAGIAGNQLVLVGGDSDFGPALAMNDPWLRPGQPVFARDLGTAENEKLLAAFPERAAIRLTTGEQPAEDQQ